MPVVGLILYFFFGQNIRKEKYISERSLNKLTKRSMLEYFEQKQLQVPEEQKSIINLFYNQSLALPFKDNEVEIFTNGTDFFTAFLSVLGQAKHHIHLESYIIDDDALGQLVADVLIDKAREGVEVRFIYDDVGSLKNRNAFYERMKDAGIDVQPFLPVRFPLLTSKINYRNHRKLCIVDGSTAFIGGMNIAMRYVRGTKRQAWRDTHLLVRGGGVYGIQRAFLIDWYFVDRTLISDNVYYPPIPETISNNCIAQVITSSPVSECPEIMQGYVRILVEAKRYVYMESPYFLPTEPVLFAMGTAAMAGVDVRLMLPLQSDSKLVEWASRSYVAQSIKAGVKIYYYKAAFNHSKLLVSDDRICTCGSTNVDFRSFENNLEANIFFYDEDMALRMKQVFLSDLADCVPSEEVHSHAHLRWYHRLIESVMRLFSPLM